MNLLVLGGTVFLGRTLVEHACARGHTVTLFNRGQSAPESFPNVKQLHGDRDGSLEALEGRTFDACIDTCGYVPRIVRQSVKLLSNYTARYAFISSLSVYADPSPEGTSEEGVLASLSDPTVETVDSETYGPLKASCEQEVVDTFSERALILRPGLIVGPHDPTDRFTYWPWRADRGGKMLAPGRPERTIQLIDVRDLAKWILHMIETGGSGAYNAVSSPGELSMSTLIQTCRDTASKASFAEWVPDDFLVERGVKAWTELPLWIPENDPLARGFFQFRNDRALHAGLRVRPLHETVRDTLAWARARSQDHVWRGGLSAKKERELLATWLRES